MWSKDMNKNSCIFLYVLNKPSADSRVDGIVDAWKEYIGFKASFTPSVSICVNPSIKIQMGSGPIQKHQS